MLLSTSSSSSSSSLFSNENRNHVQNSMKLTMKTNDGKPTNKRKWTNANQVFVLCVDFVNISPILTWLDKSNLKGRLEVCSSSIWGDFSFDRWDELMETVWQAYIVYTHILRHSLTLTLSFSLSFNKQNWNMPLDGKRHKKLYEISWATFSLLVCACTCMCVCIVLGWSLTLYLGYGIGKMDFVRERSRIIHISYSGVSCWNQRTQSMRKYCFFIPTQFLGIFPIRFTPFICHLIKRS